MYKDRFCNLIEFFRAKLAEFSKDDLTIWDEAIINFCYIYIISQP